jgi:hypothetical protein
VGGCGCPPTEFSQDPWSHICSASGVPVSGPLKRRERETETETETEREEEERGGEGEKRREEKPETPRSLETSYLL